MKDFKGTSLTDRLQTADKAKRALLEKMRAMPKVGACCESTRALPCSRFTACKRGLTLPGSSNSRG